MTLYMQVSNDRYELPMVVADNFNELRRKSGYPVKQIERQLRRFDRGKRSEFCAVEVDMLSDD